MQDGSILGQKIRKHRYLYSLYFLSLTLGVTLRPDAAYGLDVAGRDIQVASKKDAGLLVGKLGGGGSANSPEGKERMGVQLSQMA